MDVPAKALLLDLQGVLVGNGVAELLGDWIAAGMGEHRLYR
jgi:hypothetical protein